MADALLLDTEAAVMSSFAFLPADVEMDDEDYMGEDMDMGNDADMKHLKMKTKGVIVNDGECSHIYSVRLVTLTNYSKFYNSVDDADAEAEEVLNDLNRLVEDADDILNLNDSQRQQEGDWSQHGELKWNFAYVLYFLCENSEKTNPPHFSL